MVGHKCAKCGKVNDDAGVCPSCEPGRFPSWFPADGEVLVVEEIVRNERGHDPRRKPKERSRA